MICVKTPWQFCLAVSLLLMSEARVENDMTACNGHFYKSVPPAIRSNSNLKAICQMYDDQECFATLYNQSSRIPIYSAFQLTSMNQAGGRRSTKWYVEPQLSGDPNHNMATLNKRPVNTFNQFRQNQATVQDYESTGYDKGHLNPNAYHPTQANRNATFTMTNVVPQDPCFNRINWVNMENHAFKSLKASCDFPGAKRYIVTGASGVSADRAIPQETDRDPGTVHTDLNRVSVPSHMWSAICCDSSGAHGNDRSGGWSYGYYGLNTDRSSIEVVSVESLELKIVSLDGPQGITKIFTKSNNIQNCVFSEENSKKELDSAEKVALSSNIWRLEENPLLSKSSPTLKRFRSMTDDHIAGHSKISKFIMNLTLEIQFYRSDANEMLGDLEEERLTCDMKNGHIYQPPVQSELRRRRRDSFPQNDDVVTCQLEELEQRGDITVQGHLCLEGNQCGKHGSAYSWCYVNADNDYGKCCDTACEYNANAREYTCDVGSGEILPCVPHLTIHTTYTGTLCRKDHLCGTHGDLTGDHWCYIDDDDNYDYCCASWHSCGFHGKDYNWCWTGDNQHLITDWDKCMKI